MHTEPFETTSAGRRLVGRLDRPDGTPRAYAIFAHCFTCTKASLAAVRVSRALAARGIGVLRFDFTGLGDSAGRFEDQSFSAEVDDLQAVGAEMVRRGWAPRLLIGHSLGGAAALAAAGAMPTVAAVATIGAPFDVAHVTGLFTSSLETIAREGQATVDLGGQPFLIGRSFVNDLAHQDQGARTAALGKPLLILHSPVDAVVDVDNAAKIFTAAKHPKSFVSLDGADHLLTRHADADYAAEIIASWASRYVLDAATTAPATTAAQGVATVRESGAGRFQAEVQAGGARFLADEPVAVGGLRSGPTPFEILAGALAACTVITVRMYAQRKGWTVGQIAATVAYSKPAGAAPPDLLRCEVAIAGPLADDQRRRLLEIAARCPVHLTLERGVRIEMAAQAGSTGAGD